MSEKSQKAANNNSTPFDLSHVRNRIVAHIELLPSQILDHPGQAWDHPESQAKALVGILDEVGIVDEILVYKSERAGGAYVTPDGHLRKSLDQNHPWPCTVLDLTDEEADYILLTKDMVGQMKMANAAALDSLLSSVSSSNQAVQEMLADVAAKAGLYLDKVDNPEDEWKGMPEFGQEDATAFHDVIVHFDTVEDVRAFARLIDQNVTEKTKSIWFPEKEDMDLNGVAFVEDKG
jgi:hypothetical protein